MQPDYFQHQLYPLQDKILARLGIIRTGFYLTGGTAVSRHYLHHRYSDDLDLFVNRAPDFNRQCEQIIALTAEAWPETRVALLDESFVRLFVWERGVAVKVELINDVGFRVGEPVATPIFYRTDSWQNILANKITALSRNAPKDVADLLYLSRRFSFSWRDAIEHARQKDTWVDELDVSEKLYDYPVMQLADVNWITPPDFDRMQQELKRMGLDVFEGKENSLAGKE